MNTFEEYGIVYAQIEALKVKGEELKAKIVQEMVERGDKKVEKSVGSFTISHRKTWTYSPKVKELEECVKTQKAIEESSEIATYVENPSLLFKGIKI